MKENEKKQSEQNEEKIDFAGNYKNHGFSHPITPQPELITDKVWIGGFSHTSRAAEKKTMETSKLFIIELQELMDKHKVTQVNYIVDTYQYIKLKGLESHNNHQQP